MKENLVIRDGLHFRLRVNGKWHDHQTLREAHCRLSCAGLDSHKMLASAISVPAPFDIEYRPRGRHRWWLNGNPVPVKCVKFMLSEVGCDKEVIEGIIRGHKRAYEIEHMTKCP